MKYLLLVYAIVVPTGAQDDRPLIVLPEIYHSIEECEDRKAYMFKYPPEWNKPIEFMNGKCIALNSPEDFS